MKDPELEAYVEAIEGHLRARRGVDRALSPRDFQLARTWHQAGIPLATVLVGVDLACDADPALSSLATCRRRVEELAAARPMHAPSKTAAGNGSERVPVDEIDRRLKELEQQLAVLPALPRAAFEAPLRKIREVMDLLAVATRPNWPYVAGKLREIDDDVSAAAISAVTGPELDELRHEATRVVERHRGRVDHAALDDACERFVLQRTRERLNLPRVALL